MLLTGRAMNLDDLACMSNVCWTAVETVSSVARGFIMNYHHTWTFLNYKDIDILKLVLLAGMFGLNIGI
jgi:hypothetical protein